MLRNSWWPVDHLLDWICGHSLQTGMLSLLPTKSSSGTQLCGHHLPKVLLMASPTENVGSWEGPVYSSCLEPHTVGCMARTVLLGLLSPSSTVAHPPTPIFSTLSYPSCVLPSEFSILQTRPLPLSLAGWGPLRGGGEKGTQEPLVGVRGPGCRLASRFTLSLLQSLSRVQLFATPWNAARQASLSITKS